MATASATNYTNANGPAKIRWTPSKEDGGWPTSHILTAERWRWTILN